MRGAWLALIALVVCLASTEATQKLFLGGTFSGLDGFSSRHFAQYDAEEGKWVDHVANPGDGVTIHDLDSVRGGVFVVGSFDRIAGRPSDNVAFWDGIKWCAIRQGLDTEATSVWCDSDTSCWVAGAFTQVRNLQDSNSVQYFARYVWDDNGNEWVFDATQRGWSFLSANTIGNPVDVGSLVVLPGASHFFVSTGGYTAGQFVGARTIYRGSKADNGFWVFIDATVLSFNIIDFSIDLSESTPVMYLVTDDATDGTLATVRTNIPLTFACESDPCVPPLTTDNNYTQVASSSLNSTIIRTYHRIFAAPNDVRYLIATYDPDGDDDEYSARQRVMRQTGTAVPELVGSAFEVSTATTFLQTAVPLSLLHDGRLLVQGSFEAANLYYPPTPLTTDTRGPTFDRRSQDLITGFAVFNTTSSLYEQAFGGGFGSSGHQEVRWVHDNETNQYYFLGSSIRYVYNTRADKAAWYDDDESLTTPLFPLFDRNLLRRGSQAAPGSVYAITCDTSACRDVFVGGDFSFHGPDSVGSIAKVSVGRTARTVTEVGGGLYSLTLDLFDPDVNFQNLPGSVYALGREGDYLYVAGLFERGGQPTSTVCLSNIARIDVREENAATAAFEDLDGGCDAVIYDIEFFNGKLFAAGGFQICGDAHVGYVAAYNHRSTGKWESLRVGLAGAAYSLEVFQGRLIVGGAFDNAGGLPVSGVASWDGSKWRALLPACTDDCVGTREFYFDNLVSPSAVYDLKADPADEFLYARGNFDIVKKRGAPSGFVLLVRWEYTDGDLGRWTPKGDHLQFDNSFTAVGDAVAFLTNDVVVVAGNSGNEEFNTVNGHISPYNTQLDNWYGGFRTQSQVFVVAEGVGSAAALSSPLASLLAFF